MGLRRTTRSCTRMLSLGTVVATEVNNMRELTAVSRLMP